MKKGILVALVVLGLVMGICLSGLAGASTTCTTLVIPKVNVQSGGSLSIVGGTVNSNQIDFENMGPGTTQQKTLTLGVTANDVWRLTVGKSKDLYCSGPQDPGFEQYIPSSSFTYTSSGPGGFIYKSSDTQFEGNGNPPSDVVTNGLAVSGSNVNVVYKLVVPGGQPKGYYVAHHTYTLIVG